MINELRDRVNFQIKNKQENKEELYERISRIDNELLELNDTLIKICDDDAFFKMSPNEAFDLLKKIGYDNRKAQLDVYINLISKIDDNFNGDLILENNNVGFELPKFFQ